MIIYLLAELGGIGCPVRVWFGISYDIRKKMTPLKVLMSAWKPFDGFFVFLLLGQKHLTLCMSDVKKQSQTLPN